MDEALSGDLITGRTVVLVTHNIALTAPIASRVIVFGKNGTITSVGPVDEVLQSNSQLRALAEKERQKEVEELAKEDNAKEKDGAVGEDEAETEKKTGKLVVAEEVAIGRVAWKSTKLYILAFGGPFVWTIYLGLEFIIMLVNVYQKWIMGYWSNQYETHPAREVNALK